MNGGSFSFDISKYEQEPYRSYLFPLCSRELISNASDAIEKYRYTQLTQAGSGSSGAGGGLNLEGVESSDASDETVSSTQQPWSGVITVNTDKVAGTITIADNGIGMTKVRSFVVWTQMSGLCNLSEALHAFQVKFFCWDTKFFCAMADLSSNFANVRQIYTTANKNNIVCHGDPQ